MSKEKSTQLTKMREDVEKLGGSESVLFLLDVSGSMRDYLGVSAMGSKMDLLQKAMVQMLEQRQSVQDETEDLTGIVKFRDQSAVLVEGCKKVNATMLGKIQRMQAGGGTPLYQAMWTAVMHLDTHAKGLARIVVVSDGEPNDWVSSRAMDNILTVRDAIEMRLALSAGVVDDVLVELFRHHKDMVDSHQYKLKNMIINLAKTASDEIGVIIDTVGIGHATATRDYDELFMIELANAGGGTFYEVETEDQIMGLLKAMESERRELLRDGILLLGSGEADKKSGTKG